MDQALVSAATGALTSVLEKLAVLLNDESKRFKGVRREIHFLTQELVPMHAFLLKMSDEEDPDVQDKMRMNELREFSYLAEDSIDDFMQSVDDKDTKPCGFMEKIKHSLGNMKARCWISNPFEDLKKQAIAIHEKNARYKILEPFSNTKNVTVDPRALAIYEHVSKLVGIDEPKAEIIKLLTEEDGCASTQEQVKVVSIVGSGGMGKTTLANQVYQELKGHFECQTFLSVSRNPNMEHILRTILSQVSNQYYAATESEHIQKLIDKIRNFLKDKRYFIVVDDIWDHQTWKIIWCAFPENKFGSKIITTTRTKNVAHSCCSSSGGHVYNIRPLNMVHSKQLFHARLFKSEEDCPPYLEDVSEQILKKCDGLPLAIIAIAGLLDNTKKTEDMWNQVNDSVGRALARNPGVEAMMKIVSLSYFDLPCHLKTCLLYFSIFPEDSIIRKKDLIRRWLAEEFISKQNRYTQYELGELCFNELINRSLIQPVKTDGYGEVKSCRVHDTILDFIIAKSTEKNFVTVVGVPNLSTQRQSKICRLSLQAGEQENLITSNNLVLSHVRSLDVSSKSVQIPSLDKFKHLRVLDFGGCYWLENHHLEYIGRLFQLRYLNLQWTTQVSKLPEEIGHLRCLEMLDLRNTTVGELPTSIVNLKRLVHLFIGSNVTFPCGMAKMQALETLKCVHIFKQPRNFLQELRQLRSLKKLALNFETDSSICSIAEEEIKRGITAASLEYLGSILSLAVWNGRKYLGEPGLFMPHSLEKLVTSSSVIRQLPVCMRSLGKLQVLSLEMVAVRQNDLCILGHLPALRILIIVSETPSEPEMSEDTSVTVSVETGFPVLRMFCHIMSFRGMDLMFAAGAMPMLDKLEISFDANKTRSLSTSTAAFEFGIENLPSLVTLRCVVIGDNLEVPKAALESAARRHCNNPTLLFVAV